MHLTLKHINTQNGSKCTNHKSRTTTYCFLRGSLRCKGEKAKKALLFQILIDVVEKHKIQRRFCIASRVLFTNSCKSIDHLNGTWSLKPRDLILRRIGIDIVSKYLYSKPICLSFQKRRVTLTGLWIRSRK